MDLSFLDAIGGPKVAGTVVASIAAFLILGRLMKPKEAPSKTQFKQCGACGWSGSVTLFKPKCPKCNAPL